MPSRASPISRSLPSATRIAPSEMAANAVAASRPTPSSTAARGERSPRCPSVASAHGRSERVAVAAIPPIVTSGAFGATVSPRYRVRLCDA